MDEMKEKEFRIDHDVRVEGTGEKAYLEFVAVVAKNLELPTDKIASNDPELFQKAGRSATKPIAYDLEFWIGSVEPKKKPTPLSARIRSGNHPNARITNVEFTDKTSYKDPIGLVSKMVVAQAILEKVAKESPFPTIAARAEKGARKLQRQALKYIESPNEVKIPKSVLKPIKKAAGRNIGFSSIGVASIALVACSQPAEVAPLPEIKPTEVSIPTPEAPVFAPTAAPSTSEAIGSIPLTTLELANATEVTWYEFASTPDTEPGYKLQQVIEDNKEALGINGEITANTFFSFKAEGSDEPIGLYGLVFWNDGENDKATFVYGRDPKNRSDSGTINSKRLELYGQATIGYSEKQDDGSQVRYLSLDFGDGGVSPVIEIEENGTLNWVFNTGDREIPFATVEDFEEKTGGKLALIIPEKLGQSFAPELAVYNPETGQMETITGTVIEKSKYWDGEIQDKDVLDTDARLQREIVSSSGTFTSTIMYGAVLRQTRVVEFNLTNGETTKQLFADFGIKNPDGKEIAVRFKVLDIDDNPYSSLTNFIANPKLGVSYDLNISYTPLTKSSSTGSLFNSMKNKAIFCPDEDRCRLAIGEMGDVRYSLDKLKEILDTTAEDFLDFSQSTLFALVN